MTIDEDSVQLQQRIIRRDEKVSSNAVRLAVWRASAARTHGFATRVPEPPKAFSLSSPQYLHSAILGFWMAVQRNERVIETTVPDFRLVFESIPGPTLVLLPDDPTFTIIAVSNIYLQNTGTTRERLLGRNLFEILPHSERIERTRYCRLSRISGLARSSRAVANGQRLH